jgi:hypothetical protein
VRRSRPHRRQQCCKLLVYPAIFIVAWLPTTVFRILELLGGPRAVSKPWMNYVSIVTSCSVGVLNALALCALNSTVRAELCCGPSPPQQRGAVLLGPNAAGDDSDSLLPDDDPSLLPITPPTSSHSQSRLDDAAPLPGYSPPANRTLLDNNDALESPHKQSALPQQHFSINAS